MGPNKNKATAYEKNSVHSIVANRPVFIRRLRLGGSTECLASRSVYYTGINFQLVELITGIIFGQGSKSDFYAMMQLKESG